MGKIEFYNETNEKVLEEKELKKLIKYALKYMNLKNVSFSVIFVDNDKIHKLNKDYRNIHLMIYLQFNSLFLH